MKSHVAKLRMGLKARLRKMRSWFQSAAALSRLRFIRSISKGNADPGDGAAVIVTMTTYHMRFEQAKFAIESILQQKTDVPFAVHLYLSSVDIEILGEGAVDSLQYLVRRGLRVTVVEENLRSYKKLVYALVDYPGKVLVTADDDVCYPRYWLHQLIQKSKKFPNSIVCFRGHRLSLDGAGNLISYGEMMHGDVSTLSACPSFSLMPTGVSGILYPPGSLAAVAVDDELFLKLAPSADDVWFKVAAMLNGTSAILVSPKNVHFPHVPGSQDDSLFELNVAGGRNDVQMAACFSEFEGTLECLRNEARHQTLVSGA
jgi:hypothetical protein